jgi:hypothetical protein
MRRRALGGGVHAGGDTTHHISIGRFAGLSGMARRDFEVRGLVRGSCLGDERDADDPESYVTVMTRPVQPVPRRQGYPH